MPRWLWAFAVGATASGPLAALTHRGPWPRSLLNAVLISSTAGYLVAAFVDLAEHFRLEKLVSGRSFTWQAIPPSETAVHTGIIGTNLSVLLFARPLSRSSEFRKLWLCLAPGVFLALGWFDELGYHRRRTQHREDLIHTVQHLAEGIMWTTLYATRVAR